MSVLLSEVLNLNIMKDFQLICGREGLNRTITKVGILDHEIGEVIDNSFIEGEFVLTNLLLIKDDLSQLEDVVNRLINAKTAGLAIKTLYIDEVPDAVIRLARTHNYPVFLYEDVYYEDIITELVEYIKTSTALSGQMALVHTLLNESLSIEETQKIAYKLNPDFRAWISVIKVELSGVPSRVSAYHANKILGIHHKCYIEEGLVTLFTSFDTKEVSESTHLSLLESIGIVAQRYSGGISNIHTIDSVNLAYIESDFALQYSKFKNRTSLIKFDELGLYKALLPLEGNRWLIEYCKKIVQPIIEYDEKNGADLMKTAQIYIENGCDIKKTAELLYQHGNTIRYRMDRIKGLLEDIVEKAYIDQELSVAIRWYGLNQRK